MKRHPIATACTLAICLGGLFPGSAGAVFEANNSRRVKISGGQVKRTALTPNLQSALYVTIKRTIERGGTSISSVARLAGLAVSSAQSAMRVLTAHGYVSLEEGRYQATLESALQLWSSVARRGLSAGPITQGGETGQSIHAVAQEVAMRHPVDARTIRVGDLETPEAYSVMMKLYRERADVGTIAKYAGLEPGNVYAIVSRLTDKGYLTGKRRKNAKTRRSSKKHSLEQSGEEDLARGLWLGGFLPNLYVAGLVSQSLFENGPVLEATHRPIVDHREARQTPHSLSTLWCILYGGRHTTGAIAELTGRQTSAVASTLSRLPPSAVKVVDLSGPGVTLGYWPNGDAESLHRHWHGQGGLIEGLGTRAPALFAKAKELAPDGPWVLLDGDPVLLGTSRASIHLGLAAGVHSLPSLSKALGLPANNIHSHLSKSIGAGLVRPDGAPGTNQTRFHNTDAGLQALVAALALGGYLPSMVRDGWVTPARPWDG